MTAILDRTRPHSARDRSIDPTQRVTAILDRTRPHSARDRSIDPTQHVTAILDRTQLVTTALDRIEQLITELVRAAPVCEPSVADELVERLEEVGSPLARAIACAVELVAEQRIDPGIALPPLAMACATLADGVRGALTERELEAARYEIETLLPVPDRARRVTAPDVPLTALRKRES